MDMDYFFSKHNVWSIMGHKPLAVLSTQVTDLYFLRFGLAAMRKIDCRGANINKCPETGGGYCSHPGERWRLKCCSERNGEIQDIFWRKSQQDLGMDWI